MPFALVFASVFALGFTPAARPRPHNHYVLGLTVVLTMAYIGMFALRHVAPAQRLIRIGGNVGAALVPRLLGIITFLAGTVLILSGATPAFSHRLEWLIAWIPLPVIELSHFVDNLTGVMLLILARGVERRLDVAYHLTIVMLVLGILLSLLRALDVEQAIVLACILGIFAPSRKYFNRRASLIEERFTRPWIIAIMLVVIGSIALGWVSYANLHLSTAEFFRFRRHAEAARFLRATAGALAALVIFAVLRLIRPARPVLHPPTEADLHNAEGLVRTYPEAAAHLALIGDKQLLFTPNRDGFVMYGVQGRTWVSLGDPVAPPRALPALISAFATMVDGNNGWPVFYKVSPTFLYLYLDQGLTVVKLGEEARVRLTDFSLDGAQRRNIRRVCRKMVDAGCVFEVVMPEAIPPLLPELRAVSDAWLTDKETREKGFSLGAFSDAYVSRYPVAIVRREGRIVAFANVWMSGEQEELEVDLMRYTNDAPPGVMRFVLAEFMVWGRANGYRWFNLGMAPLSGLDIHARSPVWNQIAAAVRGAGERFYNFEGIREFKQWFYPEWEPRFLISPGGAARPIVLANIASLIAGGIEGTITK